MYNGWRCWSQLPGLTSRRAWGREHGAGLFNTREAPHTPGRGAAAGRPGSWRGHGRGASMGAGHAASIARYHGKNTAEYPIANIPPYNVERAWLQFGVSREHVCFLALTGL